MNDQSTNELVVYGTPLSPFVRKVEGLLHHAGLAYDFENVTIMDLPDWFVEISPARRIPVLRDRTIGTEGIPGTIADSSAIALYLDRRFDIGLYGTEPYHAGRIAWFEEYADTNLAMAVGLELFRPIIFPLFGGKPSDLDTARKAWTEKLPPLFDYLEKSLDGGSYLVGGQVSLADFAVAAQMAQIAITVGLPDAEKWPALVKHTEAMMVRPGFAENLAKSSAFLSKILPVKPDLG